MLKAYFLMCMGRKHRLFKAQTNALQTGKIGYMSAPLIGLFGAAFSAATFLPGSSEAALVAVLAATDISPAMAVAVATVGNTLGSVTNWAIGRYLVRFRSHRLFPIPTAKFDTYTSWYQRWGVWSLLLSWMPFVGDPLTAIAGVARTPLIHFIPIVLIAKGVRYLAITGLFNLFS